MPFQCPTPSRILTEKAAQAANAAPPHVWFVVSAVFHYLGPAFAVLLFPSIGVLGVAWLRIATAAVLFAPVTRPWRTFARADRSTVLTVLALGACLAAMNCAFYLALDRLPISLVAAIEFVGTIAVALAGLRSRRNLVALVLSVAGVGILIDVAWSDDPVGLAWALANGGLFVVYIVLGHRAALGGAGQGIARLGAAMAVAFVFVLPVGITEAVQAFGMPALLAAGIGVGVCSSVIPYICDQLAMAKLPRASYAAMLALLPATATIVGAVVLSQIPTVLDLVGIALVITGIATHRPAPATTW